MELQSKTLAQIVNENHQTAAVFEKYGLDFCCKGKRSLQTACEEKHLPSTEIADELNSIINMHVKPALDFEIMPLKDLANHIVSTHHTYVKQEGPQILAYLHKIASKHGERHNELYQIFEVFDKLKAEMDDHMRKEELVLFPRIAGLETFQEQYNSGVNIAYIESPISVMEHEHDDAGLLLEKLKKLTNNYQPPADACTTYRLSFAALKSFETDLHQHIHLENNILFPRALELFRKVNESALN